MRRVISLWLPTFATDRQTRRQTRQQPQPRARRRPADAPATAVVAPLATVAAAHGGIGVVAVNAAAAAAGVRPGLPLAEARAVLLNLAVAGTDPAGDRGALERLADWCGRYTPWTAVDTSGPSVAGGGDAGLWLDVSGCAHLFGGEAALLDDLVARLCGFGLAAAAAVADTPGAAWAAARFGVAPSGAPKNNSPSGALKNTPPVMIVPPGKAAAHLMPLPVAALRLAPATVAALDLVGLRRVSDLADRPRAPLAARFGEAVTTQLDRALGAADEPISPRRPMPAFRARLAFAEPIGRAEDIAAATARLLTDLCLRLEAAHQGARRLELALYRTDGSVARAAVGTARPERAPDHLARLFTEKLDDLDPGFGVETAILAAVVTAPLAPIQGRLDAGAAGPDEALARLVDRLGNRLAADNVVRLTAPASHVPERACRPVPAAAPPPRPAASGNGTDQRPHLPRPLTLLAPPEPLEVTAPVPDGPPAQIRRGRARHRIVAAAGPERIAPEWWRDDAGLAPGRQDRFRDYYRVEDEAGRRFWVFREGAYRPYAPPRWYLHGVFP